MIAETDIEKAYDAGCVKSRVSLSGALQDEKGERLNAVFEVLEQLSYKGSAFGAILDRADGGVQSFYALFYLGRFPVIIQKFEFSQELAWPFSTIGGFASWLNLAGAEVMSALGGKTIKHLYLDRPPNP